jgi:hypothetical protein
LEVIFKTAAPGRQTESLRNQIIPLAVIVVLHLYSIWALGATFWYDSANYLQLGFALGSQNDLTRFYGGPNYYIFQHLMPGFPPLLSTTVRFFVGYGWLALAAIQHLFSVFALLYFLNSYRHWVSPGWRLVTGILSCAHPYYMAFHDAVVSRFWWK